MLAVHPVAILRALFCMVCSLCVLVSDIIGDQTVQAYSSVGLIMVLQVLVMVSFCLPQVVVVSALMMFSDLFAFVLTLFVCSLKVSFGSKVTPNIFG